MSKLKVAVLMGGISTEREISLITGKQILAALNKDKYNAYRLDTRDELAILLDTELRPDLAFIALHGRGGEDGTIQGFLELAGIPYTGSGVLASAIGIDKVMSKRIWRAEGIPLPGEITVERSDELCVDCLNKKILRSFGYPVVVKPNAQGSSVGCAILQDMTGLREAVESALEHDPVALIEQFVSGTEITVGLLGNDIPQVLPIVEIVPRNGFYDYESKYTEGECEHILPARISELAAQRAREYAVKCHQILGCRGVSRVDMIVDGDHPWPLEINTIPGMIPMSLLPDAALEAGISFSELLDIIISYAL